MCSGGYKKHISYAFSISVSVDTMIIDIIHSLPLTHTTPILFNI